MYNKVLTNNKSMLQISGHFLYIFSKITEVNLCRDKEKQRSLMLLLTIIHNM